MSLQVISAKTVPPKYIHTNPLTFFVVPAFNMARYRDPVFHLFVHPFIYPSTFALALIIPALFVAPALARRCDISVPCRDPFFT